MTRGRLVVHGHFYQPSRVDPFTGRVLPDPSAAPYPDWNARIDAECYRPNAAHGTFARISFDLGPALADWIEREDRTTYERIVTAGRAGSAMALPFNHTILPLASFAERRTEIAWGLRDFELRFARRPTGAWLPETAVDLPTLRLLHESGIRYTVLAPWQAAETDLDVRQPHAVSLGGGRTMIVIFYEADLSGAASFEPGATVNADRFARELVAPRLAGARLADGRQPLVVLATDGELYGHHQKFRDLFLAHLVAPRPDERDRGFDVVALDHVVEEAATRAFPTARIRERTSWSCHHGVARWAGECPDARDGRWKGPLRSALDRLAAAIDAVSAHELPGIDALAARDGYVDVVVGRRDGADFAGDWLGTGAPADRTEQFLALMEAQRWRLAMFTSDAWFWDDPVRLETKQALRAAARAVRLVDGVAGTRLEPRLREDLSLFASPSTHLDGAAIYRTALEEIGQPGD